jgi:hypothetical protein
MSSCTIAALALAAMAGREVQLWRSISAPAAARIRPPRCRRVGDDAAEFLLASMASQELLDVVERRHAHAPLLASKVGQGTTPPTTAALQQKEHHHLY